jgi:Lar family restriction alleviation protein
MPDNEELLNCPFCGGTDGYVERMSICVYQYNCDCGVVGPPVEKLEYEYHEGEPEKDAIKAWNTRATNPDTITISRAELEGMKESATAVRIEKYTAGFGDGFNAALDAIIKKGGK